METSKLQHTGLTDGTRIVPRGDGWVVVDDAGFVLDDPDTCTWVADEHDDADQQVEPLVFPSPEDAYAAYTRQNKRACYGCGDGDRVPNSTCTTNPADQPTSRAQRPGDAIGSGGAVLGRGLMEALSGALWRIPSMTEPPPSRVTPNHRRC